MNYEQWLETQKKYPEGTQCFVMGCDSTHAYYEGGDARYECPMCEEHANMECRYDMFIEHENYKKQLLKEQ